MNPRLIEEIQETLDHNLDAPPVFMDVVEFIEWVEELAQS